MTTNATTAEDRFAKLGIHLPGAPTPFGASSPLATQNEDHYALKCDYQPGTKSQAGQFSGRLRAGCQERSRRNRRVL
jgi:hypothetical protein